MDAENVELEVIVKCEADNAYKRTSDEENRHPFDEAILQKYDA